MNHSVYLSDPGIYKKGGQFYYHSSNKKVSDIPTLTRLKSFRVPPAWKSVWYSTNKKCHVQVHGVDQGGKKQYILSEAWVTHSRYKKYTRMKSFIKDLVSFRRLHKLNDTSPSFNNVMCLLFNLLMDTHIRVGNEKYTPRSYGLTTLRQKHYINGSFTFVGKSGIEHCVPVPDKYTSFLRKLKRNNPNDPLFWYSEGGNSIKTIHSEELNDYLKKSMGKEYTCKDFRTYSANVLFIKAFLKNVGLFNNRKECILKSIDESAKQLGHSRNISRKSYISDTLLDHCLETSSKETFQTLLNLT